MPFQGNIYFFDTRGEIEEIVPSPVWAEVSRDGKTLLTRGHSGAFKLWSRSGDLLWEKQDFDHGALSPEGDYAVLEDGTRTVIVAGSGDTLGSYDFGVGRPVFSSDGDMMIARMYRRHLAGEGVLLFASSGDEIYTDAFDELMIGGVSISQDGSRAAYLAKPFASDLAVVRSLDREGLLQWEDTISASYYGCQLSEDGEYIVVFGADARCYDNWTGSMLWEYPHNPDAADLYFEGASAMENPDLFALTLVSGDGMRAELLILGSEGEVFWKGAIPGGDYWRPEFHQNEQLLAVYGEHSYLLYDLKGLEQGIR
jgi:WD40 repeat protein